MPGRHEPITPPSRRTPEAGPDRTSPGVHRTPTLTIGPHRFRHPIVALVHHLIGAMLVLVLTLRYLDTSFRSCPCSRPVGHRPTLFTDRREQFHLNSGTHHADRFRDRSGHERGSEPELRAAAHPVWSPRSD